MDNNFEIEPIMPLSKEEEVNFYNATHIGSKIALLYLGREEIKERFNIDIDEV